MSGVPSPAEFDALCLELVEELHELRVIYRLAHGVAYSRQVVESVPTRTSHVKRMDQDALEAEAQAVLADHALLRGKLRQAAASVRDATRGRKRPDGSIRHVGFTMATDHLRSALVRDERRHGEAYVEDNVRNPRTASFEDLTDSVSAQRRRSIEAEEDFNDVDHEARPAAGEPDLLTAYRRGGGR